MSKEILIISSDNSFKEVSKLLSDSKFILLNYPEQFELSLSKNSKIPDVLLLSGKDNNDITIKFFIYLMNNDLINFPVYFLVNDQYDLIWLKSLHIPESMILNTFEGNISIDEIINLKFKVFQKIKYELENMEYFSGNFQNYTVCELFLLVEKYKKNGVITINKKSNEGLEVYFECYFKDGAVVHTYSNLNLECADSIKQMLSLKSSDELIYECMLDIIPTDSSCHIEISKLLGEYLLDKKFQIKKTTQILNSEQIRILLNGEKKKNMIENYEKPIEIAEDIYWVSQRDPKSLLQLNSYLRMYKKDNQSINLLIDPGAIEFYPTISRKVSNIIKDVSKIHMFSVNHQDPDVGMNSTFISKINSKAACLCTEDTWRLIQFYEIPKTAFKNVYSFQDKKINLPTSDTHAIEFIPTPYCHFVGAFALYDRASRAIFTGDLFGGLNPPNNLSLFATEDHWEGIKTFHQIYMPSKVAIQRVIDHIRSLDLPPLMIVPQHGAILKGEVMEQFLNRLYHLDVGMDLFDKKESNLLTPVYLEIMNNLYHKFVNNVGLDETNRIFNFNDKAQELFYLVEMDSIGIKDIFSQHERALVLLLNKFSLTHDYGFFNELKAIAIKECLMNHLPIPASVMSFSTEDSSLEENSSYLSPELNFLK